MSRIDPLRGRLARRDLLKMTGAAAGAAALGDLTGRGVLPASERALARQDAANAIIFGVGTDVDELDPRTTDTQEGYYRRVRTSTTAWCSTISARPPSAPDWPNRGRFPTMASSTPSTCARA